MTTLRRRTCAALILATIATPTGCALWQANTRPALACRPACTTDTRSNQHG